MADHNSHLAAKTAVWSIWTNTLLALCKAITGYFGNSYALIADAIESTSDIFASILVLLGIRYATKPADENHPYGHGKVEPLTTFAVVVFLVVSATIIFVEAIHNIRTPHQVPEKFTLIVLGSIILIKEFSYRFVKKRSEETNSQSLKADAWHHRSDAITSLLAFIGITVAIILGDGYEDADDWAAMIASLFIIYNAYLIFRPALSEIMDEHIHEDLIAEIRNWSMEIPSVKATEKCHVRKMGMHYLVDLHIEVDGNLSVAQGHDIAHQVKDHLTKKNPLIANVLIHVEPENQNN